MTGGCGAVWGPRGGMVSRVRTVAFQGIEAVPVDVQIMVGPRAITELLQRP